MVRAGADVREQTITGAMGTINPPVSLADADNQFRLDYIQDTASQLSFDYPPVCSIVNINYIGGLMHCTIQTWPRVIIVTLG